MKLAIIVLAYFGSVALADNRACESQLCQALGDVYQNLPAYVGQIEDQLCGIIHNSFLNKFCHTFLGQYAPQIVDAFRQQIQQQAAGLNCDLGNDRYMARDDCDDSAYCQQIQNIYNQLPSIVDQIESQLCGIFQGKLEFLGKVCHTFVDTYKGQLLDAFRQQIAQQAAPAGCHLDGGNRMLMADRACDSQLCDALAQVYQNLPAYVGQIEDQLCGIIHNNFLNGFCHTFLGQYAPQIVDAFRQQIQQQAAGLDCDLGGSVVVLRDDCDNSPYCQQINSIYNQLPAIVDDIENKLCSIFHGKLEFLGKVCHVFVDTYKGQLLDAFRQQIAQQAAPAGCHLGGSN